MTAPDTGEAVLIDDPDTGTWACLTRDDSSHRRDIDEGAAVATMLLRGLVGGGPEGSFVERLEAETAAIAKEHRVGSKPRNYLVLRLEGVVPDWESRAQREVEQFVIRVNGPPKIGTRDRAKVTLSSIVIGITQQTGRPVQLSRRVEGIVFFRADGKKIHAKEMIGGPVSLFVSGPWTDEDQAALQADFLALRRQTALTRVYQLHAASFEQIDDRLRSFQSAWSALEILVNKVFSEYEAGFLRRLTAEPASMAQQWYIDRIRDVMKDKYRLRDRFALVTASLAPPGEADTDMAEFLTAKKARDALAHGRDIADVDLPVEAVQRLLSKYVRLHARHRVGS